MFVRIWGTTYIPLLRSGSISRHSLGVSFPFSVGDKKGVKYLSMAGKQLWCIPRNTQPVIPSMGAI